MPIQHRLDSAALRYLRDDVAAPELSAYLAQLEEEGFATIIDGETVIAWDDLYRLLAHPDHQSSLPLLQLPEVTAFRPVLASRGALSDSDFSIFLDGWRTRDGGRITEQTTRAGGLLEVGNKRWLLPEAAWRSLESVKAYARLPVTEKTRERNFREWSRIRALAKQAGAVFDNFLDKTVVLTPEALEIRLHRTDVGHVPVVEVEPAFAEAPENWLAAFDKGQTVLPRYDLPTASGGIVHVVVEPGVQQVLSEIKGMPGRRIAGDRAQAFLRNPYAVLGAAATQVILPQQFERARAEAGVVFFGFRLEAARGNGRITHVNVVIAPDNDEFEAATGVILPTPVKLELFLDELSNNLAADKHCFLWKDYELELGPQAAEELERACSWLVEWTRARILISADEVYDLTCYAPRVESIGDAKPIYSPYIVREGSKGGWLPENIEVGITFRPAGSDQTVLLPISSKDQAAFTQALAAAQAADQSEFRWPGLPAPVSIAEAQAIKADIDAALGDIKEGKWTDGPPQRLADDDKSTPRSRAPTLCIAHNIEAVDYAEQRQTMLAFTGSAPVLPSSLLPEVRLLDHQHHGVAWLQHLWRHSPAYARGCLLADDMGLGKTLQLLTFLAHIFEAAPDLPPALIVAPVALLDNWEREIKHFFAADTFRIHTLYGRELLASRVSSREIDEQLLADHLKRFLRPSWREKSNLVLTTYETLRDYEFSLGRESWSVMICDEAQKIKSPAALVTRAAKSMNARFKIAATGTPVENSLTDLWCLFDFIQPGLLGALNDFGRRYKRPIEARTDQELTALEALQVLFAPQLLRRTKGEVATDLLPKTEDASCRAIPISGEQRRLYAELLAAYNAKIAAADSKRVGQAMLGMLHHLRLLCAHPVPMGMSADISRPLHEAIVASPKLGWLLDTLETIRQRNDKAIVFTELRDIQRVLQHYIGERFGVRPVIVNGDTDARSDKASSRQNLIDAYQRAGGFGVIILSTQAVGFGLNIQAANHVIHYTRPWNPAKEDQATDRAYRIGQKKPVTVYYPTINAQDFVTFEKRLDELLTSKRALATKTWLNGADELSVADFGHMGGVDGQTAFSDYPIGADELDGIEGDALERVCALLWEKQGFHTYQTPTSGDGGVDVVAIKGDTGLLIQCKASSRDGHFLGWDAVRDVVGGEQAYRYKHPGVTFQKVAVTNQSFNTTTRHQAELNVVKLYDLIALLELLSQFPVSAHEFRLALAR